MEYISTRQVAARIRVGTLPERSDGGKVRCACHPEMENFGDTESLRYWSKGDLISCAADPSAQAPALARHEKLGIVIDTRL